MHFSVFVLLFTLPCIMASYSQISFQFPPDGKHVTKVELYGSDVFANLLKQESYAGSYTIKESHFNYIEVPEGTVDTLNKNTYVLFKFMKDDGFYKVIFMNFILGYSIVDHPDRTHQPVVVQMCWCDI